MNLEYTLTVVSLWTIVALLPAITCEIMDWLTKLIH